MSESADNRVTQTSPVSLQEGVRYTADHASTQAVRTYLQQETTIQLSVGDLTTYEWLVYVFTQNGRPLPWLALAMAPLGYWHQTLRGQPYVVVSVTPTTHAIMEWQDATGNGHLGYVTSVSPQETVTIEQMGDSLPAVLQRQRLTAAQWRELRPVFISVR